MAKRFEIVFPTKNLRAVSEMHENLAPKTCKAIWNALPHEGVATTAKRCGNEVWTMLKPSEELKSVPKENITIYPRPADIMYAYFPPAWEGGLRGEDEPICDVAIWYGPDSPIYQQDGPHPMNHFATIIEGLDNVATVCGKTPSDGPAKILLKKLK